PLPPVLTSGTPVAPPAPAPPSSTLFPYTTLSRSPPGVVVAGVGLRVLRSPPPARQGGQFRPAHARQQPLQQQGGAVDQQRAGRRDRKSTRLNSSHVKNSYAVFCSKKNRPAADEQR